MHGQIKNQLCNLTLLPHYEKILNSRKKYLNFRPIWCCGNLTDKKQADKLVAVVVVTDLETVQGFAPM